MTKERNISQGVKAEKEDVDDVSRDVKWPGNAFSLPSLSIQETRSSAGMEGGAEMMQRCKQSFRRKKALGTQTVRARLTEKSSEWSQQENCYKGCG